MTPPRPSGLVGGPLGTGQHSVHLGGGGVGVTARLLLANPTPLGHWVRCPGGGCYGWRHASSRGGPFGLIQKREPFVLGQKHAVARLWTSWASPISARPAGRGGDKSNSTDPGRPAPACVCFVPFLNVPRTLHNFVPLTSCQVYYIQICFLYITFLFICSLITFYSLHFIHMDMRTYS